MPIIEITAWSKGFKSPECVQLLHSFGGLDIAAAKSATASILQGKSQEVTVRSAADARLMVAALIKLGASAHVKAQG